MSGVEVGVGDGPDESARTFLQDRINEFNYDTTGIRDGRELFVIGREGGEIVGGIYGWTWGGTCDIQYLWVREDRRGAGLGSRLLRAAEEEAERRGCAQVVVATHSFQAPEFYRRFGYEVTGDVEGYPVGHSHITLRKPLSGGA